MKMSLQYYEKFVEFLKGTANKLSYNFTVRHVNAGVCGGATRPVDR